MNHLIESFEPRRLMASGALDTQFSFSKAAVNEAVDATFEVYDYVPGPFGRTYLIGRGERPNRFGGISKLSSVVAIDTKGRVDKTFSADGVAELPGTELMISAVVDEAGDLFIVSNWRVLKLRPNGTADPKFGTDGTAAFYTPRANIGDPISDGQGGIYVPVGQRLIHNPGSESRIAHVSAGGAVRWLAIANHPDVDLPPSLLIDRAGNTIYATEVASRKVSAQVSEYQLNVYRVGADSSVTLIRSDVVSSNHWPKTLLARGGVVRYATYLELVTVSDGQRIVKQLPRNGDPRFDEKGRLVSFGWGVPAEVLWRATADGTFDPTFGDTPDGQKISMSEDERWATREVLPTRQGLVLAVGGLYVPPDVFTLRRYWTEEQITASIDGYREPRIGASHGRFIVRYRRAAGQIDHASADGQDLRVVAPDGSILRARLLDTIEDAGDLLATYVFNAPGGGRFGEEDDGDYQIRLMPAQIRAGVGETNAKQTVGVVATRLSVRPNPTDAWLPKPTTHSVPSVLSAMADDILQGDHLDTPWG